MTSFICFSSARNLAVILLLMTATGMLRAQQEVDPTLPDPNPITEREGYVYQWGDEFNYEGTPDPTLWQHEIGMKRGNEAQCYTDRTVNANVTGGRLLLTGRKETWENPNYDPSSSDWRKNTHYAQYTSASIIGKDRRHFLYGYIVVRAKLDISDGAFPAIWTCGYNKDWPQNGEIDIMEYYKTGSNYVLTSNFCAGGDQTGKDGYWAQKWQSKFTNRDYYLAKDPDWFSKYHLFTMEWNENTINLAVDGDVRNTVDVKTFKNWDGSICFNNPQFMMLNLAIKDFGDGIKDEIHFEVDYFRVYQKKKDAENPTKPQLQADYSTSTTIGLSWTPSTDDTGILRYDIYKGGISDGHYVGSTTGTSYVVDGLNSNKSYTLVVRALDGVGNHSDTAQVVVRTAVAPETRFCQIVNESGYALSYVPDDKSCRIVTVDATDKNQQWAIIGGNESCQLFNEGAEQYLGLTNANSWDTWSATFYKPEDASIDHARFSIEDLNNGTEFPYGIKNKKREKYLGMDNNSANSKVYCDKATTNYGTWKLVNIKTTSIHDIDAYRKEENAPTAPRTVFDLQGRQANGPSRRGIYIIDGKKVAK